MGEIKVWAPDETIQLVSAKAKEAAHGDSFVVKIHRRQTGFGAFGGRSEMLAALGTATLDQICNVEQWLPKLVGGGQYIVKVYSDSDPGRQIGGDLVHMFGGEPKALDLAAIKTPAWRGPTEVRFPDSVPQTQQQVPFAHISNTQLAPNSTQQVQPNVVQPNVMSAAEFELKQKIAQMEHQLQQTALALQQREVSLREEQAMRREEQLKREADARFAALEAKLDRAANAQPQKGSAELLTTLATTLMPLVQAMMAQAAESKNLMMKMQHDAQIQFQQVLLKTSERPAMDPQITALVDKFQSQIDRMREQDPAQHSVVTQMADAFGGMTNMVMTVMSQLAESGLGGQKQDSTVQMIFKELAKAVGALGQASAQAARPQRRLPPRPPQPQLAAPPQAPASAAATGPQQPAAQVVNYPKAVQQNGQNGLAGMAEEVNPLDAIEERIRAEEDPAAVATAFIGVINNQLVQDEINQAGGLIEMFQARLGDWVQDNLEYAQTLLVEVQNRAIEAGVLVPDEAGTVEGETVDAP